MPPRRYTLDTNIYRYLSTIRGFETQVEGFRPNQVSAVVLCELWRSARTQTSQVRIKTLEQRMERYIFTLSAKDWRGVGHYLSERLSHGKTPSERALVDIQKAQNDALIALSAWNRGLVVVTCDKDFEPIQTWAKAAPWQLVTLPSPAPTGSSQARK